MNEKRIYVIIPRNLDIPGYLDVPPKKITVTCGVASGYTGHATALMQRELFREIMTGSVDPEVFTRTYPKGATLETIFKDVVDVSFQFILTLMVSNSAALGDARYWLANNKIKCWVYFDQDKKFEGEIPAAIVTEPLDEDRAQLLKAYKPWRCECNSVHDKSTERHQQHCASRSI